MSEQPKSRPSTALLPQAGQPTDIEGLLADIYAIVADIPPQEWEKLPRDLSVNLDHYLYGVPKKL